jgi:hypothetical protein
MFGYLDDFLLCSQNPGVVDEHIQGFRALCHELGVPLAEDKTSGPSPVMVFLGIGVDIPSQRLFLDRERIRDTQEKIGKFLGKRSHTRKEWQSMVGTLSFLSQVVLPGRAFMTRVSRKLSSTWSWCYVDASTCYDLKSW